jgi:hypothetical protein
MLIEFIFENGSSRFLRKTLGRIELIDASAIISWTELARSAL